MSDLSSLTGRIDAELESFRKQVGDFQAAAQAEYDAREERFHKEFVPAAQKLAQLAKPRLQLLVDRFQNRIEARPTITEHVREVVFDFNSPLAYIQLVFRLTHDAEVRSLVLDQTLKILPILMKFEDHSALVMPLGKIDEAAAGRWLDDRIVDFVKTVNSVHQNQLYLKDHLVTDPVAGVQMPKYAAKASVQVGKTTYYFISDDTKREFERKQAAV